MPTANDGNDGEVSVPTMAMMERFLCQQPTMAMMERFLCQQWQ